MTRLGALGLLIAVGASAMLAIATARPAPSRNAEIRWQQRALTSEARLVQVLGRARRAEKDAAGLRRTLAHKPSSLEALRLASVAYGVSFGDLYRVASCESTGSRPASPANARTLNHRAVNHGENAGGHPTGLMQFKPSTWATTPYRAESIWSPYAQALAAAWAWVSGRRGEWACR